MSEALTEFSQYQNQPGCPTWLYKAQVAGIYDVAKQYDKGIEYNLEAIQDKPVPALYLDLANRYVRYMKDPAKAREALATVEKVPMVNVVAKPFQQYTAACVGSHLNI